MNTNKAKQLDDLKAKMAAKSGGGGGFGGGFGSSGGGFGGSGGGFGSSGGGFGSSGGSGGGFGGGFGGTKLPKRQQQVKEEVIVEHVEEKGPGNMFAFNMDQIDKSLLPPKDNTKPIMVAVVAVVAVLFGVFLGSAWYSVFADRGSVNERIEVAKRVEEQIKPKVDHFQTFAQIFKQRSESLGAGVLEYNKDFYTKVIKKYKDSDFILDISELEADSISMASNAANNPLSDIRGYAAGTSLLAEILDSHIEQTDQDLKEINALLGQSSATDRNIVYALKVDAKEMLKLVTPQSAADNFNRLAKAITCTEVYQVKRAITDDEEASKVFQQLISDGKISEEDAKERTFSGGASKSKKSAKEKKADEPADVITDPNLVLPKRLMYVLEDNDGNSQVVFADEIILIERNKLFAGTPNALERYKNRMIQVLALLGEIEKTTDGLTSRLHIIATEDPL